MHIDIPYDSGNIVVIDERKAQDIHLNIRRDSNASYFQWFHFIITGQPNEDFILHIENAGQASYPGWNDFGISYRATSSSDGILWTRLPTSYDEQTGILTIRGKLADHPMQIAFFPPYPYARHAQLIEKLRSKKHCHVSSIGQSLEGRDISLVTLGSPGADKKNIWIVARQHPGETMAEWFVEGLIDYVTGPNFPETFFDNAVLYIVPNMNPDGSYLGNLRTNAAGLDLNRQWDTQNNQTTSPEVYYVRNAILQTGAAAFFDIHGDETHPHVFLNSHATGCALDQSVLDLEHEFIRAYRISSPYLQEESCYKPDQIGMANKNIASAFISQHLGCLSLTIEMPSKELENQDWTVQDCKQFGANLLQPIMHVLPKLANKF